MEQNIKTNTKIKTFSIDNFKVQNLTEIKDKREKQLKIVEENPYIEIIDYESFEKAKRHRTALVKSRTDLEKEQKILIRKIKEKITEPVVNTYAEFINITKPHEEKQQSEVKRYEAVKEAERQAKIIAEQARKDNHLNNINIIVENISEQIKNLTYEDSLTFKVIPTLNEQEVIFTDFEEFETNLYAELESLKFYLSKRKETLAEQEYIRQEKARLASERADNERIFKIKNSISDFYAKWAPAFTQMSKENMQSLKDNFEKEKPLDCQEYQNDYALKRADLVKIFEVKKQEILENEEKRIEAEKVEKEKAEELAKEKAERDNIVAKLKADAEKFEKDKREFELEKQEIKKSKRIEILKNLGFDDDLVLNHENLKIIFPIDDILCAENDFLNFINDTKEELNSPTPEPTPEPVAEPKEEVEQQFEFSTRQKKTKEFLETFCNYCLNKYGEIKKEHIVEFIKQI